MNAKHYPTYGQAPRVALWIGILLILIGLVSRYIIGIRGVSSLTPTFFGMPIAMLGFLALEPEYARGAMRGLTALAVLGILLTLPVLPLLNALRLGQPLTGNIAALVANTAMLLLCGTLLIVCIVAFGWVWYAQVRR
jgi:hypothetical protein